MQDEYNELETPVVRANMIRIYPIEWVGYPCLRFDAIFNKL